MKKTISLFLFLLSQFSFAQNLVPNPSFEDTVSCPTMGGQVTKAKFWYDLVNTPDYFHSCCSTPQFSVPNNTCGYQYPSYGNAYMGLVTYLPSVDTNYREIIGAYLVTPMQIGTKYYCVIKTSRSGGTQQAFYLATNKLGILLSTAGYSTFPLPVNNFCQIYSDSIVTDTLNWVTLRNSFTADSAYTFLAIGNFFMNYLTDTIQTNPNNIGRAYYYLDDICISNDSLYCEMWTGLSEETIRGEIKIYPNPGQGIFNIENIPWGCNKIEVLNVNNKVCRELLVNRSFKATLILTDLPANIYSVKFYLKNSIQIKKIINLKN